MICVISHMFSFMLMEAVCAKEYAQEVARVILHRWRDTMPSRQQGLPEIEVEAREKATEDGKE